MTTPLSTLFPNLTRASSLEIKESNEAEPRPNVGNWKSFPNQSLKSDQPSGHQMCERRAVEERQLAVGKLGVGEGEERHGGAQYTGWREKIRL